jgi:hypothetical protein
MNSQTSIELHIEELVLHGFSPRDRHSIAEAVQGELTRLLADPTMRASLAPTREIARLDAGSIQVAANSKPGAIGAQVAQSFHRGLKQ